MNGSTIRKKFLDYFAQRNHQVVPSAPLIPRNDPSLFFTNAGMVQFKDVFTGDETRDYTRATSAQKVMRVSGKHNDLENVGRTPRHHTFFEMLGNFSFGDYFKVDAIRYAWDMLTNVLGVDPDPLWITVFDDDDEAAQIWIDEIGLPPWKVVRMGAKENFWTMGDTGPCGPCSEIHVDRLHGIGPKRVGPDQDEERFLEIWNLVFMQFLRSKDGSQIALPRPSIDTGMGLERICSVIQGKTTNYDTDIFQPIIQRAAELAKHDYGTDDEKDTSLRIIADHSRAAAFLIADGVMPSKESRGYVLRRVMRRAIRHGVKLGLTEPFMYHTVNTVIQEMGEVFPELSQRQAAIETVVQREEEQFARTLGNGLKLFHSHVATLPEDSAKKLDGEVVFKLYDTYGFPVDLTQVIAEEQGVAVDMDGFESAMDNQRNRARQAWTGSGEAKTNPVYNQLLEQHGPSKFTGYDNTSNTSAVQALLLDGQAATTASVGQIVEILCSKTPFYGESGGQAGDVGTLKGPKGHAKVVDTRKPVDGLHMHVCEVMDGEISLSEDVELNVNSDKRDSTRRNHTATHLLHAALRNVLGEHVTQRGSLVAPDRLRFDFSHFQGVSPAELQQVEDQVNDQILQNTALDIGERSLKEAMESGVMALFGEKYGDRVRVVNVPGFSTELCGGTHVQRTGDIGPFKILSEAGIASGIRRIEAQSGLGARRYLQQQEKTLVAAAELLKIKPDQLVERLERLVASHKEQNNEISKLKAELLDRPAGDNAADTVHEIGGCKLIAKNSAADSAKMLREQSDRMKEQLGENGIIILTAAMGEKVTLLVAVGKAASKQVSAKAIIQKLAPMVNGRGGGKAEMAQAGGSNPAGIPELLAQSPSVVEELLSA